ncbi:MAG: RNA polymerase sigma factor [Thiobacillaceae bacterium]|nr:RNA polymerase sigma factor [Thiobacillaceae bacterium]
MATDEELDAFLSQAERRAYKTALYTVQDHHAALDIVQNAMLKLCERYHDRPAAELPLLFQRILQNAITDHHRRARVRNFWVRVMAPFRDKDDQEAGESLEDLAVADESTTGVDPVKAAGGSEILAAIEVAIAQLPLRQRQAFLLRYWEEMDVAEVARAMGCSEGSVKTHSHRALNALAKRLKARGIEP